MFRDSGVALPRGAMGCLRFVIVVFPDHTHLLLVESIMRNNSVNICQNWASGSGDVV